MRSLGRYTGQGGRRAQIFPASQDALARLTGVTFADLWLFQDAASPAANAISARTLAAGATPTWGVASSYPRLAFQTDEGEGDRCESADAAFDYDGTTSAGFLLHLWLGAIPAANRQILGKRSAATGYDLQFLTSTGYITWFMGDGTDTLSVQITTDHASRHQTFWVDFDRNAGTAGLSSPLGNQTGSLAGIDSLSNAANFRVGAVTSTAPDARFHLVAHATGSSAEGHTRSEVVRRFHRGLG